MAIIADVDETDWAARGLAFVRDNGNYRFILHGRSDVCDVPVKDGKIAMITERSSAHRALAAALGYEV